MATTTKALGFGADAGKTGTDTQSKAATAGHVIRTYSETILCQPTTGIPIQITTDVPEFIPHINMAQANATHFNLDILPVMSKNVADLLSFSNNWNAYTVDLRKYAKKGDYKTVVQGLKILQGQVKTHATGANSTHTSLLTFQNLVEVDMRSLTADYNKLINAQTGIPAEVSALDKSIDAYQSQIGNYTAMIAGGAGAIVVGIVIGAVGIASLPESGPAGVFVIAGGIAVAAGGIALIVTGSVLLVKASNSIRDLTQQKAALNAELAILGTYKGTMGNLRSSVSNAVTAIGNLAQSWDYLYEDMNAVIHDLENAKGTIKTPWFDSTLTAADSDWAQVGSMAKRVQDQTADAKYKKVKLDKKGSSLLDALPKKDRTTMIKHIKKAA